MEQNIRFTTIGRRAELPDHVLAEIDESVRVSQNNAGMTLCLAINYGGRTEIVDAVRTLAERVKRGESSNRIKLTRPHSATPSTRPACPTRIC